MRNFFQFYNLSSGYIARFLCSFVCLIIMASPGDKKGQCRGSCGHIMASFDNHEKCMWCREKRICDDPCVKDMPCEICDNFAETQKDMLSTPTYRVCKEKKSGMLVSPEEVTVIASVEDKDTEPSFQSPPYASTQVSSHAHPDTGT